MNEAGMKNAHGGGLGLVMSDRQGIGRPISSFGRPNYDFHPSRSNLTRRSSFGAMRMAHFRIIVQVHGVGFRQSALKRAAVAGLCATAQNLPDGTVELHVEGDLDELKDLLVWANQGPALSQVTHVDHLQLPPKGIQGKRIIH